MRPADTHLTDAQLVARRFGAGGATEERHLLHCQGCARRDTALASALDDDRERLDSAADTVFTPARLAAQREAILARLEHPRRARVLAFPHAPAEPPRTAGLAAAHRARWIAAAAVLLSIAGAYGNWWIAFHAPGALEQGRVAGLSQSAAAAPVLEPDHEAVLSAIDTALRRPGAPELVALDVLTPRAGDPIR